MLDWIAVMGNKLPHPFWLFLYIIAILLIISNILAALGVSAVNPSNNKVVQAMPLISAEGLRIVTRDFVKNFRDFLPLTNILSMMVGVGLAEGTGLLGALMRKTILAVPANLFIPVACLVAVCGNAASDPAIVLLPALFASIFAAQDKNPLIGVALGYGVTCTAWAANLGISATNDVVLLGFAEQVAKPFKPVAVPVVANWYFNVAAAILTAITATFVTRKYVEPRLQNEPYVKDALDNKSGQVTELESKGLKYAGIAALVYIAVILILLLPPNAPLRNPKTGTIMPSPFIDGLVAIMMFLFFIPSYVYGRVVGTIKKQGDAPKYIYKAIESMAPFILMCLIVGQFLALFNYSNIPTILAVKGAEFLKSVGFTGAPLWTVFILFTTLLNLLIGSSNTKWFAFAPIFVPMLMALGYHPATTTMAYRIGDSVTNGISPLFNYYPILLGYVKRYSGREEVGPMLAALVPYSIANLIGWTILFLIWTALGIPLGPGGPVYLP